MTPAKQQPRGLGRGLGELFVRTDGEGDIGYSDDRRHLQASEPIADGSWFAKIPVDQISPNPQQPRRHFDDESLDELADSLTEVGLLQPVVVRQIDDNNYELVMGERRLRAHQRAKLATIPAIVRATDSADMLRDALLENLHRVELNPLEEAAAYQQMIDDFGCTQDELASKIKKSRPHISNTIRLLKLPPAVQRRVAAGVLSAGHARALLSLSDVKAQEQLASRIVAEGFSVRATEEAVMDFQAPAKPKRRVPQATADASDQTVTTAESSLTEHLDTRVRIRSGKDHGTIFIDYADNEDLVRLVSIITTT